MLKDGDQLLVPDERQEVSVLGEVQYATSHVYRAGAHAGRVHQSQRWAEPASRQAAHLRRSSERRGRGQYGRGLVPAGRWLRNRAGRLDRRADRRRSAAGEVERDHADHLQPRDRCGGGELVLRTRSDGSLNTRAVEPPGGCHGPTISSRTAKAADDVQDRSSRTPRSSCLDVDFSRWRSGTAITQVVYNITVAETA